MVIGKAWMNLLRISQLVTIPHFPVHTAQHQMIFHTLVSSSDAYDFELFGHDKLIL